MVHVNFYEDWIIFRFGSGRLLMVNNCVPESSIFAAEIIVMVDHLGTGPMLR